MDTNDDLALLVEDYFTSGAAQEDMEAVMQYEQGQPIWWLYTPRGGYGYTERVIAVFVKGTAKRAGIAVLKADYKTWVPRWVNPDNIKPRGER